MTDQKRSLLAAGLSILVLVGWFSFFGMPPKPLPSDVTPETRETVVPSKDLGTLPLREGGGASNQPVYKETRFKRQTNLLTLEWTNQGARLSGLELNQYRKAVQKDSPPISLIDFEDEKPLLLLCEGCNAALPETYRVVSAGSHEAVFEGEKGGLVVRKTYEWKPDQYLINLKVDLENRSGSVFQGRVGLGWFARQHPPRPKGFLDFLKGPNPSRSFLYKLGRDVVRIRKDETKEAEGNVLWAGIEDRYFLISLISRSLSSGQKVRLEKTAEWLKLSLFPDGLTIPQGAKQEEIFSFYIGPKERSLLQTAGAGLEEAVDYGWFSILAVPIVKLLQIFHAGVKNWGVAIILLTLFVKVLMNPLTVKSMKQMKGMQKLQPQLTALKEKYKNDRQALNAETMQLFRNHKVNPMGGCLPMVLQMPIYIALYKVLYNSVELYHAPFVGFYRDLAAPDPYFILPILLGISMVLQQKLTPSPSADPVQKQMMTIMPVMFTAFMLFLPVGLVLYIFVNTAFSVLQQWMSQKDLRWRDLLRGRIAR